MSFRTNGNLYVANGGLIVALGATTVEQTGMLPGEVYEFSVSDANGVTALARWGADDASAADAGFDFAIPSGAVVRARCPTGDTAINIIEAEAGASATAQVLIARVNADE
jgi:hypothetical protein